MKVGLVTHSSFSTSDSLNHVFGTAAEVLRQQHELVYLPPEFVHARAAERRELLKQFVLSADVLLGPLDEAVLGVREAVGKSVPYVCFLLGSPSRGAQGMIHCHRQLRTTDILVGNCTADLSITRKLFPNAQARLLPFAFDDKVYYPLPETAREAARARLGFKPSDKVLIYAGRLTLEKNVHTLLRIFAATRVLVPDCRLIIAGVEFNQPFPEMGVFTLGVRATLLRAVAALDLPPESVSFVGQRGAEELLGLYNIADAALNMTLHHDENFGLSQVEAMACGTPVVGTNWGGLKDTILEGETGHKVSTVVTGSGVKVHWWEGVNRLVSLLRGGPTPEQRHRCHAGVSDRYSLARYGQLLEAILRDCHAGATTPGPPLASSAFARQFWCLCALQWGETPPYRRSQRAYQMYRELITPFTGAAAGVAADGKIDPADVLCLATPARLGDDGDIAVDDPIFPFELSAPEAHRPAVRAVLEAMREEPVTTAGRLIRSQLQGHADRLGALAWMLEAGLLLKSRPEYGGLVPQGIGAQMGRPIFSIRSVPHTTDAVSVR